MIISIYQFLKNKLQERNENFKVIYNCLFFNTMFSYFLFTGEIECQY